MMCLEKDLNFNYAKGEAQAEHKIANRAAYVAI